MSPFDHPALTDLPSLKATIDAHGLRADKRLGQHFLLDPAILRRIAASTGDMAGMRVLEIGPGPGGLTRALLEAGALVTAIERDPRCVAALESLRVAASGRLRIIEADALTVDSDALMDGERYRIVANLPYNVASELLLRWLLSAHGIDEMRLMFQREVADRILAAHGSRTYGRLSVLTQSLCEVTRVMDLPAGAFHPPPKVRSSLIALTPRAPRPSAEFLAALQTATAAAFQQRRKMLRSSLRALAVPVTRLLEPLGIAETQRAEDLSVADYGRIAERLIAGC